MKLSFVVVAAALLVAVSAQFVDMDAQFAAGMAAPAPQLQQQVDTFTNQVEYVDQLDTPPNPELVPRAFVESHRRRRKPARSGKKKSTRAAKKQAKKAKKVMKKALKKGGSAAVKAMRKQMKKLQHIIKTGKPAARKAAQKALASLQRRIKKAGLKGKHARKLKRMIKRGKKAAKKAAKKDKKKKSKKSSKKAAKKAKKAAQRVRKLKKQARKLKKKAKKGNKGAEKKVSKAMKKLRRLQGTMSNLKGLMTRIQSQVKTLLPENKIRRYKLDEVAKISHSQMAKTLVQKESKLVNGYKPNAKKGASYNKVVPKRTPTITKDDDLNVQQLAIKQRQLSQLTKAMAAKDDISLV